MTDGSNDSIHDIKTTDEALAPVGAALLSELERGLARAGFQTIPEDSFGVIALRVADAQDIGTAYIEFKDGEIKARIVLARDRAAVECLDGSSLRHPGVAA